MRSPSGGLDIVLLADRMDLVPVVATWHWEEWGSGDPGGSLSRWSEGLAKRSLRDAIPISWVALLEGKPVGSVALVKSDMSTHPELSPWLSGLFVVPDHRHKGVATALTAECERTAARLGVETLYLYTDKAQRFYEQRGWRPMIPERYEGAMKTVMTKRLDPDPLTRHEPATRAGR